jgi:hypothetical protein
MTTYGNLRTANEDKIEIKHGSVGGEHPAKTDGTHRTHTLGGEIAKPKGSLEMRKHTLGGRLGNGAITDCYGTTPMKTSGGKVGGSVGGGSI